VICSIKIGRYIQEEIRMFKKTAFWVVCLFGMTLFSSFPGFAQEDKIAQVAMEYARSQYRVPKDWEIKYLGKMESQIPGFLAIKLLVSTPDREVPIVIYVDPTGEKVIAGNLFIKGENVTRKEAGEPKPRKIDAAILELEKSPSRGPAGAKVTIVEFSNFECPYCIQSWAKMKELLGKYPQDIQYVFKNYPLQRQGKAFDLSAMISAVEEVNKDAFWLIHDFMFSDEGQIFVKAGNDAVKQKIEQMLKEKGYSLQAFQEALETGKGNKRVEANLAVGDKIHVRGTPTVILNGTLATNPLTEKMIESYLGK
jgi:protein-disulfide isomerase